MQQRLETLNNLIPVLAIGSLALFMTLEVWIPYFKHGAGRGRQRLLNVGMIAIGFLLNALLGGLFVMPVRWSEASNFGLLHRVLGQSPLAIVIGIFLIDLLAYATHVTAVINRKRDSHYGCVFSVLDRLFGTAGKTRVESIRFGLERFRGPREQTIWRLLKMPFIA